MSAVEALAEDLWMQHQEYFQTDSPWYDPKRGILRILQGIPSMPAEQVAELIDGEVERKVGRTVVKRVGSTNHYGYEYRAVTPWLPLGVSPETNGEQK